MAYPLCYQLVRSRKEQDRFPRWVASKRFDGIAEVFPPSARKSVGKPYHPTWFEPRLITVANLSNRTLLGVLRKLSDNPNGLLIQGKLKKPEIRLVRKSKEYFGERDTWFLFLDIEGVFVPAGTDSTADEAVEWFIREHLPPEFHNARAAWYHSGSAGTKGQELKLRMVWPLASPVSLKTIEQWSKHQHASGHGIDPRVALPTQEIFIAPPVFATPEEDPFYGLDRFGSREGKLLEYTFARPLLEISTPTRAKRGPRGTGKWSRSREEALAALRAGESVHDACNLYRLHYVREEGEQAALEALADIKDALLEAAMEGRRRGPEKGLPARAVPYIRRIFQPRNQRIAP